MCRNSTEITFCFNGKTQWQMFLLLYGRHVGAPTWRFHRKLYQFGWNTSPNNARMKNRTDLNFGKVVYISIIYHIPYSWLNLLNGYNLFFLMKTSNSSVAWQWKQAIWSLLTTGCLLYMGSALFTVVSLLSKTSNFQTGCHEHTRGIHNTLSSFSCIANIKFSLNNFRIEHLFRHHERLK